MKCPVQSFVACAMFIGGIATKPELPKTAMTGNLVVQNLTEYTLSVGLWVPIPSQAVGLKEARG